MTGINLRWCFGLTMKKAPLLLGGSFFVEKENYFFNSAISFGTTS
jgi:hypothetical protein